MAEVITMPRLSDTMTEGKVVKWHFKVGDTIKEGDILAEIETDKAIQDFESEFDGTLLHIGTPENQAAEVDTILAIIGDTNEEIKDLLDNNTSNETSIEEEKPVEIELNIPVTSNAPVEIPEGIEIITMPRLSDTMEEGRVVKWNFKVGDEVKEGDILAEIETDKAVQDFESEYDGALLYQGVAEGDAAKVDAILAIIGEKGTDVSTVVENYATSSTSEGESKKEETPQLETAKTEEKTTTVVASTSTPSVANTNNGRIFASPLAKKLAEEKGINLATVQGTGENGRIIKKDIENYSPSASGSQFLATPIIQGVDTETPNSQVRNIIAKRLAESKFSAPHYYLNIEINMDNAISSRTSINNLPDTKISYNDMIVKASAMALRKHPQVNSSWAEDKIIHHGNINIGVAVAIEDGLLVPVLKNSDQLSFQQISSSVKDLATRARDRKLKADEMEHSTFSISNLGMFGIESFTSIINQPNSCILSVGTIVQKPVVKNGQIVVGNTMKVTMACDHRVVDGATGAQFLQTFKNYMENPITILME